MHFIEPKRIASNGISLLEENPMGLTIVAVILLALAGGGVALEINARRHPPSGKIIKSF